MPMVGADAELPERVRRVVVAGASGSGKTTLARRVAATLGVPHTELDALQHGPGWTVRPTFDADVDDLVAADGWVTEYQYPSARPRIAARAELLVWLDLPRAVVMRRIVVRTVARRLRREELWHGNVEPPLHTFVTDRDHVIRWAWRTHGRKAGEVLEAVERHPDLLVVRLSSPAEVTSWVAGPLARAAR